MTKFFAFGKRLVKDEDGATAIEYGLLAALIAVAIITAVGIMGDSLNETFKDVNGAFVAEDIGQTTK